jgi:hypothetical protein
MDELTRKRRQQEIVDATPPAVMKLLRHIRERCLAPGEWPRCTPINLPGWTRDDLSYHDYVHWLHQYGWGFGYDHEKQMYYVT